jgi:hypothetical protein
VASWRRFATWQVGGLASLPGPQKPGTGGTRHPAELAVLGVRVGGGGGVGPAQAELGRGTLIRTPIRTCIRTRARSLVWFWAKEMPAGFGPAGAVFSG